MIPAWMLYAILIMAAGSALLVAGLGSWLVWLAFGPDLTAWVRRRLRPRALRNVPEIEDDLLERELRVGKALCEADQWRERLTDEQARRIIDSLEREQFGGGEDPERWKDGAS